MNIKELNILGKHFIVLLGVDFELNITQENNKVTFFYPCGESNDCSPYLIHLPSGSYTFEVWGAQGGKGGYENNPYGGFGGYSKGNIRLRESIDSFLYVGNKGGVGEKGGYNGGGKAKTGEFTSGGGGGASDIRLINNSLGNRVIVAGGGGGTEHVSYNKIVESWGGGLKGGLSNRNRLEDNEGTQTRGGKNDGTFGFGGDCPNDDSGAGGGGWFGGGYGDKNSDGGGGSGFVFIEIPDIEEEFKLSLKYRLTKAETFPGNETFYRPNNDGRGAISITFLSFGGNYSCICSISKTKIVILLIIVIIIYK